MLSAVDTNGLSALWSKEPTASRMAELLRQAHEAGGLVICAQVHAELHAHPRADRAFVRRFLDQTGIRVDFGPSEAVWLKAGEAYAAYTERRRESGGSQTKRLLVDFIVGAHALLETDQLLTLDAHRYETAFPDLRLVKPGS